MSQENPAKIHHLPPFPKAHEQEWPGLDSKMDPQPDWGVDTYKGSGKLTGQVALITGGDSGIGRAVAVAMSREGCDIAISYLPQEESDAAECKKFVEAAGRKCLCLPGDLSDESYCKSIVTDTVKQFGKLNILVNNAACQGKASEDGLNGLEYARVLKTFQVNIVAMFAITKEALKHMKAGASIINTGSIQAYDPSHPILDYACTKASIVAFTKGLSGQLAEKGIRVNCVAPGPVWTPLVAASFPDKKLQKFGEQCPMKRPGQPSELAGAYVFLASEAASFITGEVLGVTGGGILA